jgi:hypothetical protein
MLQRRIVPAIRVHRRSELSIVITRNLLRARLSEPLLPAAVIALNELPFGEATQGPSLAPLMASDGVGWADRRQTIEGLP